jgi:hypothetical protein
LFHLSEWSKGYIQKVSNEKKRSGFEQSYKIYECVDCTDCPLKSKCTNAKGNRQVQWNTVFEEMKAKAKAALECKDKATIYSRRKVEVVKCVWSHQGQSVVPPIFPTRD